MPAGYPEQPDSFALPASDIPAATRKRLSPWVAGFIGSSADQATQRLHERWASIENDSLIELRDTLTKFAVHAIVDYGDGGLIYAVRRGATNQKIGNSFYLPAAMDSDKLDSRLCDLGLTEVVGLKEFLLHFGGLAEDASFAGHVVSGNDEWPMFTDSWDGSITGFDDWKDSLMLFHARNGCHLLVRRDGRVAWWVMQEAIVRDVAPNFNEFVRQFSDHRNLAWPFDPYGPPEADGKVARTKWGYIDKTGELVIGAQFDHASPFFEGLAPVKVGGRIGFIDRMGKIVISPRFGESTREFSEGLAMAYATDDKCGFINALGEWAIKPRFDYAESFQEGIANVRVDEKYGYIDKHGNYVVEPQYTFSSDFSHGYACVAKNAGDDYWFIDRTGKKGCNLAEAGLCEVFRR